MNFLMDLYFTVLLNKTFIFYHQKLLTQYILKSLQKKQQCQQPLMSTVRVVSRFPQQQLLTLNHPTHHYLIQKTNLNDLLILFLILL